MTLCYIADKYRMAASVEKCLVCHDDFKDPRLLPCIHSFCLKCIEDYCRSKGKLPGDKVPCPVCRHEFEIPKHGVADLTLRTYDEYCSKHNKEADMYCTDCHISLCTICCHQLHKTHNFEQINVFVQQCARSIDREIESVTLRIKSFRGKATQFEDERSKFSNLPSSIQDIEQEIKNKGDEVKQSFARLVDRQVSDLLQRMQTLKSAAEEDVKSHIDAMQSAVTELEGFRAGSLEMKSKGLPRDIAQAASDVHDRAIELLQKHIIPSEYRFPVYMFSPMNCDQLLRDGQNFIGHVVKVKVPGNVNSVDLCLICRLALDMTFCIPIHNLNPYP